MVFIEELSHEEKCTAEGGTFVAAVNECEYVSEDWCTAQVGDFNECASACRNDPEAQICTLQCVPVCSLPIPVDVP